MLPSIHSQEGLSKEDSKKFITSGYQRSNDGETIEFRIKQAVKEVQRQWGSSSRSASNDGMGRDVHMIGSDSYEEVEVIANVVHQQREHKFTHNDDTELMKMDNQSIITPAQSQKTIYLVIDTNFILSHLDIIDGIVELYEFYNKSFQLIIPRTTMQELDGLKQATRSSNTTTGKGDNSVVSSQSISQLARWANDWCYKKFASSSPAVRGQRLNEKLDRQAQKDDSILDCCLYFQEKYQNHLIILMSNDKNFCMKALANGILTISYRPKMSPKLIINTIVQENIDRGNALQSNQPEKPSTGNQYENDNNNNGHLLHERNLNANSAPVDYEYDDQMEIETPQSAPQKITQQQDKKNTSHLIEVESFDAASSLIYQEIELLLRSAIHKAMIASYEEDIVIVEYEEPRNIRDVFDVIYRFWIAVFHSMIPSFNFKKEFDNIRKDSHVAQLKRNLIERPNDPEELSTFLHVWSTVLQDLYEHKPDNEKTALSLFLERWGNIMSQLEFF